MGSAFRGKDCERRSREAGDKLKREKYRFCGAERGVETPRGIFPKTASGEAVKQAMYPVMIAKRTHPFPYRTRKLSSFASMILGGRLPGKVERCRSLRERLCLMRSQAQVFLYKGVKKKEI